MQTPSVDSCGRTRKGLRPSFRFGMCYYYCHLLVALSLSCQYPFVVVVYTAAPVSHKRFSLLFYDVLDETALKHFLHLLIIVSA